MRDRLIGEDYLRFAHECRKQEIDAYAVVSGDPSAPGAAVLDWAMIEADIVAQPVLRRMHEVLSHPVNIRLD